MKDPKKTTTDKQSEGQPVGTTTGAVSGAATGAAAGAAGGPVGAVVGGVIGAVTGGAMGKGVEKTAQGVDADRHDAYWQEHHAEQSYGNQGPFEGHRAAYRTGYEGATKYGIERPYDQLEPELKRDYETARGTEGVDWNHARSAVRAAYDRAAGEIRIVLEEERLRVGKREVETGRVHVRKVTHTEQVSVPVELRREDAVIERISASEVRQGSATGAFQEQTVDVTLHAEEAVVAKESHVTGAVRVRRTEGVETQNVSDSVRKEDVEVVRDDQTQIVRDPARDPNRQS